MTALAKFTIGIFMAGLCFLPAIAFYSIWSWAMAQVPLALAYAGLIKLGVTLLMILTCGGLTFGLTVIMIGLFAAVMSAIID